VETNVTKHTVRERAESELKHFLLIAAYLFVVFGALTFFKSAILQGEGVRWVPWGFALIKAAISAKFVLLGHALHFGERYRTKPLIWETLYKSIVFLALVAVLTVIEEVLVGFIHGQTAWQSVAGIGGGTPEQAVATLVIMFLVFVPLFAFGALGEVMGEKALLRTFFVERMEFEPVRRAMPQLDG
jgi:hypothetical protein